MAVPRTWATLPLLQGPGSFDAAKQSLVASFDGGVRFLGHREQGEYVLDLSLTGLEIEVNGTKGTGTLVVDVSAKDRETKKVSTFNNLGIASLALPVGGLKAEDGMVKLTGVPATLTADGVKAFGGMYRAGEQLDALTVTVSLDKDAELPGGTAGSTGGSTTGGSTGGSTTGRTVGGSVGGSLATTGSEVPTTVLLAASTGIAAAGAAVVFAVRRREGAES